MTPLLGEYASADPCVAAQHIAWASEYGIDAFVVNWSGPASREDRYLQAGLLAAPNIGDVRLALQYETLLALGHPDRGVHFDARAIERLSADVAYAGRRYLSHPRYLKIEGRPDLFLYVTRIFTGKCRTAIRALCSTLDRLGYRVYLVGDEVFWDPPDPKRIALFEAVTAYNMYDWPRTELAGYAARSAFLGAVRDQYRHCQRVAAEEGVRFLPSVMPGYNDRGVRPTLDHYVIPRRMEPASAEGSLFAHGLRDLGLPHLDARLPFLILTPFNEGTSSQIEPTQPGPDRASTTAEQPCTQGFPHPGYGFRYPELLRDAVVAVSGRVVTAGSQPVAVRVLHNGQVVARRYADSAGGFRFARGVLPPGRYELTVDGRASGFPVEVGEAWSGPVLLQTG